MKTAVLYSKELIKYSFGEGHPLRGDRFEQFFNFFESRFSFLKNQFEIIEPDPADDQALQLVHSKDYIKVIQSASRGIVLSNIHQYVSSDNLNPTTGYVPQGAEKGAKIIVGISLLAGELVAEKKFHKAIGIGAGMHHAKPNYGEGFCFYNDVAICVKNLKQKYNIKKVLLLDTDAHAGNGTKEIFYQDPDVLFIDIHQDPRTLYPGSGFISEIGSAKGEGFTVNLPLLPGASNKAYQYLFEEIIFPLAREFAPEVIIRYGGSDPYYLDELTNLGLNLEGFRMIGEKVNELSRQLCAGRSIDFMLSGYDLASLPYVWSALLAGLLGINIDLSDLIEKSPPAQDYRIRETKDMTRQLKLLLKKYWKCMN